MPKADTWVSEYADELIETPRAHLRLILAQDERGLALTYLDRNFCDAFSLRTGCWPGGSWPARWE